MNFFGRKLIAVFFFFFRPINKWVCVWWRFVINRHDQDVKWSDVKTKGFKIMQCLLKRRVSLAKIKMIWKRDNVRSLLMAANDSNAYISYREPWWEWREFYIKEWLKGNKSRRYYNLLESEINLIFMIRRIFNCLFQVVGRGWKGMWTG